MPPSHDHRRIVRIDASAAADGRSFFASPASLLIELLASPNSSGWHTRLLAAGRPAEVAAHEAHRGSGSGKEGGIEVLARPGSVLIPGLVNAHAHLDLTHLGPRPHDPAAGFIPWIDMIREGRRSDDAGIAASVEAGLRLSHAAGTAAIGDIAGAPRGRPSLAPWRTMRRLGARGASYLEFFGIGKAAARSWSLIPEALAEADAEEVNAPRGFGPQLGLSPHAPTTVSRLLFSQALTLAAGRPVCTHLAETPEEREFIAHGRGAQRELFERLGVWEDSILDDIGRGLHPVEHLAQVLAARPFLVAHVNDATDAAIAVLAAARTSVAYCPRASEYFGAECHFGPHRYRDMLAAGINVALGTDSIVNLPSSAAILSSPGVAPNQASGISIWEEMRRLSARDRTDPVLLLKMATVNGAAALGLEPAPFTFTVGSPMAGLLAVPCPGRPAETPSDAFLGALQTDIIPEVIFIDHHSGLAGILPVTPESAPIIQAAPPSNLTRSGGVGR